MAINWKSKVLLIKAETTYGTDPTPTGILNAILAKNIRLSPMEGEDKSRDLEQPYLGGQSTIPVGLHAKIAFDLELNPSGTAGTPPTCAAVLLACAMAEVVAAGVSVTYGRVSTGHGSVAIYLWIGGTLYKLAGAKGTATMRVNTQDIPYLECELTGLFTIPTEVTPATPTLAAQLARKPLVGTTAHTPTFTLGGVALIMRSFMYKLGNQVETRFLIGSERVIITDQDDSMETTVEAVPVSTLNPFQLAFDQTKSALILVHGTVAGSIITLNLPAVQLQRTTSLEQQQNIKEWPLRGKVLPVNGNDQATIAFT